MDALNVALIGYGLGGSVFHAPLIDATAGLRLDAIVTSDPRRQAAAAARYPHARLVPSVPELLSDPERLDLVVVAVPNARHVEVAEAAMDAGRAVVIDKPVAPSADAVRALAARAEERRVTVVPYHNRRWDGDFLTARALIGEGRLGQVWRMESRFERWRPGPAPTGSWKHDPLQAGAGVLMDLGPHLIDQAMVLFGRPDRVYAEMSARGGAVDDDTFMTLQYDHGPAVHLWVSSRSAALGPRLRLLGSEAAYVKYGMDPQEDALKAGGRPDRAPAGRWGTEAPEAWGRLGAGDAGDPVETRPGAYQHFYELMALHLREGAAPPVEIADAIDGLAVIEAAMASAATRSVVHLGD